MIIDPSLIPRLGGRRFIVTMLTGLATSLLVAFGKIDGLIYSAVTIATSAAFITANTMENVATTKVNSTTDS